jgi:hypothetical protein
MWQYNYTPNPDDILHYGVPGMRWGHRKARSYFKKADIARGVARDYNKISKEYATEGKTRKAKKFANAAQIAKSKESKYKYKAESSTKYGRQLHKAQQAKESSKEWKEMAGYARQKGKVNKALKYEENAKKDMADYEKYKAKSKATIDRMNARANTLNNLKDTSITRGEDVITRLKKKSR